MHSDAQILDIACDDRSTLQRQLNSLYAYQEDLPTKIYHGSRIALFQMLLSRLIRNGEIGNFETALDIGCNAGFYSKLISDCGFRNVLGIDINPAYVGKADRAFGSDLPGKRLAFRTVDATAIPADERYDFILCTEVIEHTCDPLVVIKSIMTLLTPGGIAVVSLPNALSLGYLTSYFAACFKGRGISAELRDHLKFPFYKGPLLFRRNGASILRSAGVNCMFSDRTLLLLHGSPLFDPLNRLNFWLSRRWPWKYFAQFYFFVVRNEQSQLGAKREDAF